MSVAAHSPAACKASPFANKAYFCFKAVSYHRAYRRACPRPVELSGVRSGSKDEFFVFGDRWLLGPVGFSVRPTSPRCEVEFGRGDGAGLWVVGFLRILKLSVFFVSDYFLWAHRPVGASKEVAHGLIWALFGSCSRDSSKPVCTSKKSYKARVYKLISRRAVLYWLSSRSEAPHLGDPRGFIGSFYKPCLGHTEPFNCRAMHPIWPEGPMGSVSPKK